MYVANNAKFQIEVELIDPNHDTNLLIHFFDALNRDSKAEGGHPISPNNFMYPLNKSDRTIHTEILIKLCLK